MPLTDQEKQALNAHKLPSDLVAAKVEHNADKQIKQVREVAADYQKDMRDDVNDIISKNKHKIAAGNLPVQDLERQLNTVHDDAKNKLKQDYHQRQTGLVQNIENDYKSKVKACHDSLTGKILALSGEITSAKIPVNNDRVEAYKTYLTETDPASVSTADIYARLDAIKNKQGSDLNGLITIDKTGTGKITFQEPGATTGKDFDLSSTKRKREVIAYIEKQEALLKELEDANKLAKDSLKEAYEKEQLKLDLQYHEIAADAFKRFNDPCAYLVNNLNRNYQRNIAEAAGERFTEYKFGDDDFTRIQYDYEKTSAMKRLLGGSDVYIGKREHLTKVKLVQDKETKRRRIVVSCKGKDPATHLAGLKYGMDALLALKFDPKNGKDVYDNLTLKNVPTRPREMRAKLVEHVAERWLIAKAVREGIELNDKFFTSGRADVLLQEFNIKGDIPEGIIEAAKEKAIKSVRQKVAKRGTFTPKPYTSEAPQKAAAAHDKKVNDLKDELKENEKTSTAKIGFGKT